LDALAVRCWTEMQTQLGISPCVLMGALNDGGVASSCEVDVGNAVAMHALSLASYEPSACLDWNNNYGDGDDKCILFHCGPVPSRLMAGAGRVSDHSILANAVGEGHGYGCNVGRIAPMDFTFGSLMTDEGKLKIYLGEGKFTGDPIPDDFFGCAGVAEVANLQDVLLHVGINGHRHHVSVTPGWVQSPVRGALGHYLNFEITLPQGE
jgi:L-fucose isomerase-like protein